MSLPPPLVLLPQFSSLCSAPPYMSSTLGTKGRRLQEEVWHRLDVKTSDGQKEAETEFSFFLLGLELRCHPSRWRSQTARGVETRAVLNNRRCSSNEQTSKVHGQLVTQQQTRSGRKCLTVKTKLEVLKLKGQRTSSAWTQ